MRLAQIRNCRVLERKVKAFWAAGPEGLEGMKSCRIQGESVRLGLSASQKLAQAFQRLAKTYQSQTQASQNQAQASQRLAQASQRLA